VPKPTTVKPARAGGTLVPVALDVEVDFAVWLEVAIALAVRADVR
jgi:hypothetical protein